MAVHETRDTPELFRTYLELGRAFVPLPRGLVRIDSRNKRIKVRVVSLCVERIADGILKVVKARADVPGQCVRFRSGSLGSNNSGHGRLDTDRFLFACAHALGGAHVYETTRRTDITSSGVASPLMATLSADTARDSATDKDSS